MTHQFYSTEFSDSDVRLDLELDDKMTERIPELFKSVFDTDEGRELLDLIFPLLDQPTYTPNMTLDEVAYREGIKQCFRILTRKF